MRIIFRMFFVAIIMSPFRNAMANTVSYGSNVATGTVAAGLPQGISPAEAAKAIKQQIQSSGGTAPSTIKRAKIKTKANKSGNMGEIKH